MPRARETGAAELDALQRWFQDHTMRPSSLPRAPKKPTPRVESVILPSRTLTARERLDLYAGMYFARLHECLEVDFPVVAHLLGHAAFERLARAYLTKHPSRHYSLSRLGAKLPDFLATARVARRGLVRDVARLEWAIQEVFDAEPAPELTQAMLEAVPPDAWAHARLEVASAFRLLALDYPVNAVVTAVRQEKPLPSLRAHPSWVVVYRKNFQVWRMDLTEPMHAALAALARGKPIPAAIRAAAKVHAGSRSELEGLVFRWFAEWRAEGLFQGVTF